MNIEPAWIALLGPSVLVSLGAIPSSVADRHPRLIGRMVMGACVVSALAATAVWSLSGKAGGLPVRIDLLGWIMTLLVAVLGTVVTRFSIRHLEGETTHGRFLKWMGVCLGAVFCLVSASHLALLAIAWSGTGLALHQLLIYYGNRSEARLAARKKFIFSRLSDMAVMAAAGLLWWLHGTGDLAVIVEQTRVSGFQETTVIAVGLLTLAAVLKSAQFPFHSWLPETMEAPAPVSALMHAGVVNAGGFLVLRFSPLFAGVPKAMLVLAIVGLVTALFGSLVMLTQMKVKRALAFSTIAQMGFMMLQCGLGAWPLAMLHLVGHSLYKARAFLTAGEEIASRQDAWSRQAPPAPSVRLAVACWGVALAVAALGAMWVKGGVASTLFLIVMALGFVQPFARALSGQTRGGGIGFGVLACCVYLLGCLGLHELAHGLFASTLGKVCPAGAGTVAIVAMVMFALLTLFQAMLPILRKQRWCQALYVHLLHGFYLNSLIGRVVRKPIFSSSISNS